MKPVEMSHSVPPWTLDQNWAPGFMGKRQPGWKMAPGGCWLWQHVVPSLPHHLWALATSPKVPEVPEAPRDAAAAPTVMLAVAGVSLAGAVSPSMEAKALCSNSTGPAGQLI
jgi:hypothetical protein